MLYSNSRKTVSYRNLHEIKLKYSTIYHTSSDSKSTPLDAWLCEPLLLSEDVVCSLETYEEKKNGISIFSVTRHSNNLPFNLRVGPRIQKVNRLNNK